MPSLDKRDKMFLIVKKIIFIIICLQVLHRGKGTKSFRKSVPVLFKHLTRTKKMCF